jgi:hypothetical protein
MAATTPPLRYTSVKIGPTGACLDMLCIGACSVVPIRGIYNPAITYQYVRKPKNCPVENVGHHRESFDCSTGVWSMTFIVAVTILNSL